MWKLVDLQYKNLPQTCINGKWIPARPLNYRRKFMPFIDRIKYAWMVFTCKAEAFTWPGEQ
jgi:hypothetical protein